MQKGDDFTRLVGYVEERTILEERLQKMEAFRGSIKDIIFRRVQRDYATRLTTIRDQFRPTMVEIVRKLRQIETEKDKLSEKVDESNDLLSELRFRNEIGEFDEDLFHEQEDGLLLRLEELSADFDNLRQTVGEYMFYLHDDKDFRQMASAEKLLDRLEEDFKAERAHAAEAELVRRQAQKIAAAPAAPIALASKPSPAALPPAPASISQPASPATRPPPAAHSLYVPESDVVAAEIVGDDESAFLEQAFAQFGTEDSTRDLAATGPVPSNNHGHQPHAQAQREAPAPPSKQPPPRPPAAAAPAAAPPPRRVPEGPADPRLLKSKVIRRAPNSGS